MSETAKVILPGGHATMTFEEGSVTVARAVADSAIESVYVKLHRNSTGKKTELLLSQNAAAALCHLLPMALNGELKSK